MSNLLAVTTLTKSGNTFVIAATEAMQNRFKFGYSNSTTLSKNLICLDDNVSPSNVYDLMYQMATKHKNKTFKMVTVQDDKELEGWNSHMTLDDICLVDFA